MTNPMNADQKGRELPIVNLLPEGLTVGGRGDKIAIMAFSREITREQVLNLAAWLVALANSGGDEFEKYLAAVWRADIKLSEDALITNARTLGRSQTSTIDGTEVTATPSGHVFYNAADWW